MSLSDDERTAIISLKMAKSERAYSDMLKNFELGMFSTAANRLYYALFYASSALLVSGGFEAHSHNGNLSLINLHYVKTNIIPVEHGKLLRNAFRLRQDSDYDDYFQISEDELKELITPAKEFIGLIKSASYHILGNVVSSGKHPQTYSLNSVFRRRKIEEKQLHFISSFVGVFKEFDV